MSCTIYIWHNDLSSASSIYAMHGRSFIYDICNVYGILVYMVALVYMINMVYDIHGAYGLYIIASPPKPTSE